MEGRKKARKLIEKCKAVNRTVANIVDLVSGCIMERCEIDGTQN